MANGAFKFKDNSGNVVSFISGSGPNISFSGGTLDLSGMTGLTLGGLTISGSIQNAQTASSAPSYLLTSSFNTYSSSLATTGSNLFKGNQTISGSIIPAVDNAYDLGSVTHQFRDLYLSSASLYIDGTKVLGSTAQELQITTDTGQSFKILEAGSDTITLQSADGNITLTSSGGGDVIMDPTNGIIALKGTTTVYSGHKIVSSDGNSIQFGNGIAVTGSIISTVTPLVSGSSQISYTGLSNIPSGIISSSTQLPSGIVSSSLQVTGYGFSTTGSNVFVGSQVITGSLYITTDLIVQGCSSLQNITASAVSIGTNTVMLNTATPALRFAGISVQDSGSNAGVTGSIFWDGLCNRWIYSNPSNIGYSGGMLLSGPRTATLGSEAPLTCNYIAKSGGGDHLYDSCIYEMSGSVGINCSSPGFNLDINGVYGFNSNISSGANTAITATQNGTGYLFVGKCATSNRFRVGPTGFIIVDENSNNAGLTINQSGAGYSAIFCGGNVGIDITAPTLKLDVRGTLGIPATSGTSQYGYLRLTSNAGSSRTLDFGGYDSGRNYAMWIQATDWADLSVNSSLIINPNGGNVGIGTCTPGYKLDVNGEVAISPNTAGKNTFILTTNASNDGRLLIKSDTTNKVDIQSNGVSYFMGGNIGINCTTPNYKLHVNGCTAIDGNLRMGSGYSSGNSTDPGITVQGYTNAGVYFANCGVGLGAGSGSNLLFLSCAGNVSIGTESAYGKLSVVSSDDTVLSSALWGGALAGGIHATIYNNSQCVNSVAGLKLITRNSGASHWSMYNISTGASTGDLIFGHGSGGSGCEKLRIASTGVACFACQVCAKQFSSTFNADGDNMTYFINSASTYTYGPGGVFIGSSTAHNCLGLSTGNGALIIRNGASTYTSAISYNGTAYFCGNVGIGTPNPSYKLDVRGDGMFNGTIQLDNNELNTPKTILFSANISSGGQAPLGYISWKNVQWDSLIKAQILAETDTDITTARLIFKTGASGVVACERMRINSSGITSFTCKPSFPGATLTCTYTCTFASYTAGTWLGLFAGDNGYEGAYAFTVVGQFNLGGSAMYSINFATVPYIHKSSSIGSTNGNDFYALPHTSAGHADNGALVCFRRARYSGNTPAGNRTEICMNVSYSSSFTATTYVLAWV
jgi:hypothetical protein